MKYTESELIEGCKRQKPAYQEALYKRYASIMLAICHRYAHSTFEAEDILHEAFVKIFNNIKQFEGKGSFEGWMKHIMVNTAIKHFHKNKKHYNQLGYEHAEEMDGDYVEAMSNLSFEEILKLVNQLPDGYKMVFNLYVIEGYQHKEIADMLSITEGTSKSQLAKAKALLKKMLLKRQSHNHV